MASDSLRSRKILFLVVLRWVVMSRCLLTTLRTLILQVTELGKE